MLIFNIQRFSIHDGPGIRSVVFFKGCPLRCLWCSNPESQSFDPEVFFIEKFCIGCNACVYACEQGAITIKENSLAFDRAKCAQSGACVEVCPSGARVMSGKAMSPEEIKKEVIKDMLFYRKSGGGVTFSGGEPVCAGSFLDEVTVLLKNSFIHTAVETTGCVPFEEFYEAVKNIDLILYDLKGIDDEKHIENTGVSNEIILENAIKIHKVKETIFRIPVVPGFNDELDELEKLAAFIAKNAPDVQTNLIPYHALGSAKYERLDRRYEASEAGAPDAEYMDLAAKIFLAKGVNATVV